MEGLPVRKSRLVLVLVLVLVLDEHPLKAPSTDSSRSPLLLCRVRAHRDSVL